MFLSIEEKEEETIISFQIDLIEPNLSTIFKKSLQTIKESNSLLIILDLNYVERIDTYGIGVILNICGCCYKSNKKVLIRSINNRLYKKFEIYRINKIVRCYKREC